MLDITLGQYYPGNSFIHRLDPRTKILTTLILIVAVFLANSAIGYAALCAMVLFVIAISGLPFMLVLKSVKPLLFIIVLTLVLHAVMGQGEHVLYQWKFIKVTEEGRRPAAGGADGHAPDPAADDFFHINFYHVAHRIDGRH